QLCMGWDYFGEEPWVNRDALTADTYAWAQDINPRMGVGDFDDAMDIDSQGLRDHCDLVGESYVNVPVGVLYDLDKLRRYIIREEYLSLHESFVNRLCSFTGFFGQGPYHAVVFHNFLEDVSRKDPLRTMHKANVYVHLEFRSLLDEWRDDLTASERGHRTL